jgi:hypothetical protein
MRVTKAYLRKAYKIGRGEPKAILVAERDGVSLDVKGDWLTVRELAGPRCLLIPQSSIDSLEFDDERQFDEDDEDGTRASVARNGAA